MGIVYRREMPLSRSARGRNGTFTATKATIIGFSGETVGDNSIELCVDSKKIGYNHPIWIQLTPAEARRLGRELIDTATEVVR